MAYETNVRPTLHTRPPGVWIRRLAWVLAAVSVAFAAVNVAFELTGQFDDGPLSEYAAGLSIVNWFVAALKVFGAYVAVMSVSTQNRASVRTINVLIWGAVSVLSIYALGSLVQAIGIAAGVGGSTAQLNVAGVVYVGGFLLAAAGFAILAFSHSRRSRSGPKLAIAGSVSGVVLLGVILLVIPWILTALGIMPPA